MSFAQPDPFLGRCQCLLVRGYRGRKLGNPACYEEKFDLQGFCKLRVNCNHFVRQEKLMLMQNQA